MTRSNRRLLGAATLPLVAWWLLPAMGAAAAACDDFRAVAAADGGRLFGSAPGSVVVDGDGEGPAAQAFVTSLGESIGYAGVVYSEAAAGNVGAGGAVGVNAQANDIPLTATSSYPATPKASDELPGASVTASSEPRSSSAKAVSGGAASDAAAAGRAQATARAGCAGDGSISAMSENVVDLVNVEGVLRIGSVRSKASATIDVSGRRVLTASTDVEGASVLGQGVGIGDRGIVVGDQAAPLPDNPLAEALQDAGITVRLVPAVKDEQNGQVLAPALEITVTRDVEGVGTGPKTTSLTFGRAYALATGQPGATGGGTGVGTTTTGISTTGGGGDTGGDTGGGSDGGFTGPPGSGTSGGATGDAGASAPLPQTPGGTGTGSGSGTQGVSAPRTQLASASLDNIYPALVVGATVFFGAWLVFRFLGVRLRWR